MCGFDYSDTEAAHLEEIYSGFEGTKSFEEEIAEAEYRRRNTIATLIGLDDDHHLTQRRRLKKRISANKGLFVIIQDSRKDGTTLIFDLRALSKTGKAHPDMVAVAKPLYEEFKKRGYIK